MRIPLYVVKVNRLSPYQRGYFCVYLDYERSPRRFVSPVVLYNRNGTNEVYSDKIELCTFLKALSHGSFLATSALFAEESDILFEHPFFARFIRNRKLSFCASDILIENILGAVKSIVEFTAQDAEFSLRRVIPPHLNRAAVHRLIKTRQQEVQDFAKYGYSPLDYLEAFQMLDFAVCATFYGKSDFNRSHPIPSPFKTLLATNPGQLDKKSLDSVIEMLTDYVIDHPYSNCSERFVTQAAELAIEVMYP